MDKVVTLDSVARLREIIGEPSARVQSKVHARLDADDMQWLRASSLCFLATSDAAGRCDVSPKGDPAGSLVHILDESHIAIAERPGNRRVDGYLNVLENPHAGLVFVVPGRSDVLRINGRAHLVEDAPWFDALAVKGKRPVLALLVEIEEILGHCAKALVRAQAWHPQTWRPGEVADVSATARARRAQGLPELHEGVTSVAELEQAQVASYGDDLY